jgi:hypothetical protein
MNALAQFRQYLVGGKLMVKTNHNSLRHFMGQKDLNERKQKWVSKLKPYDFDIEYIKGKKNAVVDALSRRLEMCSLTKISADWKSHLLVEYSKKKFACEVMDHSTQDDKYKVVDDIIYYKYHIYLVPESTLKEKIMEAMHNTPLVGYLRFFKTYTQFSKRFTWKGLKDDVLKHVRECAACQ